MGAISGLNAVPENADKFSSQVLSNCSKSVGVSVQLDGRSANGLNGSERITVYGSNLSANVADMIAVKDEYGTAGAVAITAQFEKKYFPYKWIGIKYTHGTNVGTGTVSVVVNEVVIGVAIS